MATIGVGIAQLMMLLRVHALYPGHRLAIAIPALLLLAWLALQGCLMAHGEMVPNTQQDHSCREIYDSPLALSVTRAWIPLAYDTVIFVMTVWRTLPSNRNRGIGRILPTLLSDGTLYYIVICSVNLILTVMIVRAPSALKGVSAQLAFFSIFAIRLTVVMTSRVTLNLRKQVAGASVTTLSYDWRFASPLGHRQAPPAENPHPQSGCSFFNTVSSSTHVGSISTDASFTDDAKYFGGESLHTMSMSFFHNLTGIARVKVHAFCIPVLCRNTQEACVLTPVARQSSRDSTSARTNAFILDDESLSTYD
ncbi:hypothetical protein AZE42_02340 [Rhizopogon vesiculosus]|uniref:Uncharacterized protein n=1 Tax=Rhizopogon vesiculosus TaxID=180088 RepID=A0A1J8QH29_9AGAM|nr:hypothetical protein AZE42_02340 [Rhizopogon vesiculosus]